MESIRARGNLLIATAGLVTAAVAGVASALAQDAGSTADRDSRTNFHFDTLKPDSSFRDWQRGDLNPEADRELGSYYSVVPDPDPLGGAQEYSAGYHWTLKEGMSTLVETSYVPSQFGLSEWSVLGQLGAQIGGGWGVQAGVRHSELGFVGLEGRRIDAQLGLLTLEKVWDGYRSQYTVFTSRKENGFATSGHRVSVDYLYGERSSLGLTFGRSWESYELLSLPVGAGMSSNVGLTGAHTLSRSWTMNYDAVFQQESGQGPLRPEIRVGLRLLF